ncbi:neutral zinc metallopeptidase [Aeromicrobium sp. 9AM]|uniref:neutral zinc metallopeptidase n=1 Tax=Aeromicrobium sp. 9AM TaxID=2653126 RepID=UPI0012EF27FC|nr:neutral zinc metallopeptidase [Aeromicrobium sp. 9AM]VXB78845.1 Peptidase [Aeromicrobium sp. 9AM]
MMGARRPATAILVAATLLLTACGGGSDDKGTSEPKRTKVSSVKIDGDRSAPVNKLAIKAIADLQDYWTAEFPKLYGKKYKPVKGGLYASTEQSTKGPKCANSYSDVQGNAFYCKLDDSVAWDAQDLLPSLQKKYGDFVIPVVLAHEWGHAMQQRAGFFDANKLTVSSELQADCFAGAWSAHAAKAKIFKVSAGELDTALAGILDLRDNPGTDATDASAHGSGFDRVSAFQDGFDSGPTKCKAYHDGQPVVLELPFSTQEDADRGGDAPYDEIVNKVPYDIEDFFSQLYPEISGGKAWKPLTDYKPFDPANAPTCNGQSTSDFSLFYCVPEDYIGFDNVNTMPQIYSQGGDYAVATLLTTQWGLATLARLGDKSDEKTATLKSDCFAGGYTASVILHNRAKTSSYSISPGDLDEGIKALLVFRGDGDAERQGAGYGRVEAFRQGVIDGASSCLDLKAKK